MSKGRNRSVPKTVNLKDAASLISRCVARASRRSPRAAFHRTPKSAPTLVRFHRTTVRSASARGVVPFVTRLVKFRGRRRKKSSPCRRN